MTPVRPIPVRDPGRARRRSWRRSSIALGLLVLLFGPSAGRIWQRLTPDTQVTFNPPGKRPPERIPITKSTVARLCTPRSPSAHASISPVVVAAATSFDRAAPPLVLPASTDLVAPDALRGPPSAAIL